MSITLNEGLQKVCLNVFDAYCRWLICVCAIGNLFYIIL